MDSAARNPQGFSIFEFRFEGVRFRFHSVVHWQCFLFRRSTTSSEKFGFQNHKRLHLKIKCALMSHMPASILIVDDEKNTREGLGLALEDDYEVYLASGAEEAFNLMEVETFDVVLTDLRMAGVSGLKVIDHTLTLPNRPICIMMTAYGNVEMHGRGNAPRSF